MDWNTAIIHIPRGHDILNFIVNAILRLVAVRFQRQEEQQVVTLASQGVAAVKTVSQKCYHTESVHTRQIPIPDKKLIPVAWTWRVSMEGSFLHTKVVGSSLKRNSRRFFRDDTRFKSELKRTHVSIPLSHKAATVPLSPSILHEFSFELSVGGKAYFVREGCHGK